MIQYATEARTLKQLTQREIKERIITSLTWFSIHVCNNTNPDTIEQNKPQNFESSSWRETLLGHESWPNMQLTGFIDDHRV